MHPNPREKYFDQFYVSEVDDEFQVLDMGDIQIIYLESPWTEENDLDALQTVMFSATQIILEEISRKQTNRQMNIYSILFRFVFKRCIGDFTPCHYHIFLMITN